MLNLKQVHKAVGGTLVTASDESGKDFLRYTSKYIESIVGSHFKFPRFCLLITHDNTITVWRKELVLTVFKRNKTKILSELKEDSGWEMPKEPFSTWWEQACGESMFVDSFAAKEFTFQKGSAISFVSALSDAMKHGNS